MAFGGSVKLTGETEYRKALKNITQNLKEVSSELKLVTSEYGANDKSVEGLQAKSEVLNKQLEKQREKVTVLTNALNSLQSEVLTQSKAHTQLEQELANEQKKLDLLANTVGDTSQEYQAQKQKVAELEKAVSKSSSANESNQKSLSALRIELNNAKTSANNTQSAIDSLGNEMKDTENSTDDLSDALNNASKSANNASNGGFTVFKGMLANLASTAVMACVSAIKELGGTIIDVGKQAVSSYADYEQLVGGVETLFKDSARTVEEYADNAYKTAGLSANEYMQQITSFSASLISSLGGDTQKASEIGNMAIVDMSDNANKMGTDMQMLQNAYQGFSRQTYVMLDNLKLGYGGTKTEMERLLADAEKISGIHYEIGNFSDMVEAIHIIQQEMGITGTTALEAEETIEGSTKGMKGAWKNLLTGIASGKDITNLINEFTKSILTMSKNLKPIIINSIKGMGELVSGLMETLVPQIIAEIPSLLEEGLPAILSAINQGLNAIIAVLPSIIDVVANDIIPSLLSTLISMLPKIVEVGIQGITSLIEGFTQALPTLIAMLPEMIRSLVNVIMNNLEPIIKAGVQLLIALIDGLTIAIPMLIDMLPEIIDTIITTLLGSYQELNAAGVQIAIALLKGIMKIIPSLVENLPLIVGTIIASLVDTMPIMEQKSKELGSQIIKGIKAKFTDIKNTMADLISIIVEPIKELPQKALEWGKDFVNGLAKGIKDNASKVIDGVKGIAEGISDFIHFSRPEKKPLSDYETYMPDMIDGLTTTLKKSSPKLVEQTKMLAQEMANNMPSASSLNPSMSEYKALYGASGMLGNNLTEDALASLVEGFKSALKDMQIQLDDEQVGKFVDKTVSDALFT